ANGLAYSVEEVPEREAASEHGLSIIRKCASQASVFPVGDDDGEAADIPEFASGLTQMLKRLRDAFGDDAIPQPLELAGDNVVLVEVLARAASAEHWPEVFTALIPADGRD